MLAIRLKVLRKEKGISQKVLAAAIQLSTSTIAMYETNQRDPDTSTLQRLSDFFGVSVDFLLGRTEIRNFYSNDDSPYSCNENSSDYNPYRFKGNEVKKIELFNKILELLLDEGALEEGFKFDTRTETLVLERMEKIISIYKIMYQN